MLTLVWDNTRALITGKEIRVRLAVKRRGKERRRAVDPARVEEEKEQEQEQEQEQEHPVDKPVEKPVEEAKEEKKTGEEKSKEEEEKKPEEEKEVSVAAPENAVPATEWIVCLNQTLPEFGISRNRLYRSRFFDSVFSIFQKR